MITSNRWHWLARSTLSSLLISLGCLNEAANQPTASVEGDWRVAAATRSGRSTNTLDSAVFSFDTATHQLSTNFTGELVHMPYEKRANKIKTLDNPLLSELDITTLTDSTLNFHTIISGTRFSFRLVPAPPE